MLDQKHRHTGVAWRLLRKLLERNGIHSESFTTDKLASYRAAFRKLHRGDIGGYMSQHRNNKNINELKIYFNSVIDWVSGVFKDVESEMRGLEWGRLYEQ